MRTDLHLDWASTPAARFACENWHYTGSLPVGKLVKVGVWEQQKFIGVVLFAWGMNKDLGSPYGLQMAECCELVRVALTKHQAPVSKIMARALKMLKQQSPGLRLVVSFADPAQGHHGGIYQACNWVYTGTTAPSFEFVLDGKSLHKRSFTGDCFGKGKVALPKGANKVKTPGKHRYIFALDKDMQESIAKLSRPYPKRAASIDGDATVNQAVESGSTPTAALHVEVQ